MYIDYILSDCFFNYIYFIILVHISSYYILFYFKLIQCYFYILVLYHLYFYISDSVYVKTCNDLGPFHLLVSAGRNASVYQVSNEKSLVA